MKFNQDKCHLVVSGCKHKSIWVKIGDEVAWGKKKQKLLGVKIVDSEKSSDDYVIILCKNAGRKQSA